MSSQIVAHWFMQGDMTEKTYRNPVDEILAKFGHRRGLAEALQERDGTDCNRHQIGKWAERGVIPSRRMPALLHVARAWGIALTANQLIGAHDRGTWPEGSTGFDF